MVSPLRMGYIAMSTVFYSVIYMLAEMTTYLPVRGVAGPYLINHFTEPSSGFAVGMSSSLIVQGMLLRECFRISLFLFNVDSVRGNSCWEVPPSLLSTMAPGSGTGHHGGHIYLLERRRD